MFIRGLCLQVVAQSEILAGEEINVRYTGSVLETVQERRQQIEQQWGFRCGCQRCTDPTELGTHAR